MTTAATKTGFMALSLPTRTAHKLSVFLPIVCTVASVSIVSGQYARRARLTRELASCERQYAALQQELKARGTVVTRQRDSDGD